MSSDGLFPSLALPFDSFTQNAFGDRYLYQVNREAFNKVGASAVFAAFFGESLFYENTLHVVVGTDSGLLLRHIAQKGVPTGSRYLFIELPHILAALESEGVLDILGERGVCVTADEWLSKANEFKIKEYFYIGGVEFWQSIAAREASMPDYAEIAWSVDADLIKLRWAVSAALGGEGFTVCQLANLAENLVPASVLKDAFRGKTAVLLAGGPSLDACLPWVEEHRDCVAVLAVSRVARRLREAGITPDIVFTVDPTEMSFDVSKEMLEFDERVILIHAYHATPLLIGQWRGMSFYLGDLLPWKSPLNPPSLPHPGPTVTNTALSVAQAFGFSRIILGGVDLCFSRDGYTHAKGSNEHAVGPRFDLSAIQVETNGGWQANTTADFAEAARSLAMQAIQISRSGCEIVNPSPASAKMEGIAYRPLAEIQIHSGAFSVWDIVRPRVEPPTLEHRRRHCQKVLAELAKAIHQIKAIRELAVKGLEYNLGIYGEGNHRRAVKNKILLDRTERTLKTRYRQFSKLTKRLGIRDFLKITRPFEDKDLDAESAKKLGSIYYEAYRDGAQRLLQMLCKAEQRLHSRLEEEKAEPDFDRMFEQWREDRQYGRVRIWRARYCSVPLSPMRQKELESIEQLYGKTLTDTDSAHLKRAKHHSSLPAAQKRGRILLKNRQTGELSDLLNSLEHHPDKQAALEYCQLISAYLAELNGDHETAIGLLYPIVQNGESPLLEDALLRVLSISLETHQAENACSALDCLSLISPVYKPQYAEMLKLLGRPIEAVDVYNDYLAAFPDQVYIQLKLARLYFDIGILEAARMMLNYILERTSENESALALAAMIDGINVEGENGQTGAAQTLRAP